MYHFKDRSKVIRFDLADNLGHAPSASLVKSVGVEVSPSELVNMVDFIPLARFLRSSSAVFAVAVASASISAADFCAGKGVSLGATTSVCFSLPNMKLKCLPS
jgi:hypothetical protein